MDLGIQLLYLAIPLALGSYWAVIPILIIIPVIVARTIDKELVLAKNLKGYQEYMEKPGTA
jgi:protein-S-isoprenylcysteine O-methyltransferase Ste14